MKALIVGLKTRKDVLHARLIDEETGNTMIMSTLEYILDGRHKQEFQIQNLDEILLKIVSSFKFVNK